MRRLILMRHAKSDWDHAVSDHARPLNPRGQREAPCMAQHLDRVGWLPEAALLSDATRTCETWAYMWGESPAVEPHKTNALYLASAQTILSVASTLPPDARCGLLLGHNPGMSSAASYLAGRLIDLKTATAALLVHEGDDWGATQDARGWQLVDVVRARVLYASNG